MLLAALGVLVQLAPAGDATYSVTFTLSNPTASAIDLDTYEPFTAFAVRATAAGATLTVTEPALDTPVQPKHLHIPAHGSAALMTPIKLHFGTPASTDVFTWSIAHAPKGVDLTFTLKVPRPFDEPATAKL
ncbi:MAG TPA: hypothetical protein VGM88_33545 [Kofleriaceae bacterium]|jgi:hypothetical protein